MTEKVLPIAEIFTSLQGEGEWVGTPMLFVRLAGCNVGKPARALKVEEPFPILHTGKEAMACCTWDGRIFPCDTDYTLKDKVSIETIVGIVESNHLRHVCVTGGEPFLHYELLEELFMHLNFDIPYAVTMHVETSGTIRPASLVKNLICPGYWITCSPKLGALVDMVNRADELKLLVDDDFDINKLPEFFLQHKNVFLCPVNSVAIDQGNNPQNVRQCLELLKLFPHWRLSIQLHKHYGWR